MPAKNFISDEDFKILKEQNQIHDRNFQEFHKKIFNEMLSQEVFMACEILKKDGKWPGYGDFGNELGELTKKLWKKNWIVRNLFEMIFWWWCKWKIRCFYLSLLVYLLKKVHKFFYKIKKPVSKSLTLFIKIVDLEQVLFFCLTILKHFLKFFAVFNLFWNFVFA